MWKNRQELAPGKHLGSFGAASHTQANFPLSQTNKPASAFFDRSAPVSLLITILRLVCLLCVRCQPLPEKKAIPGIPLQLQSPCPV